MSTRQRVVITGVGVVSPAGVGKEEYWSGLMSGQSAIGPISLFDVSRFSAQQGAEVKHVRTVSLPGRKEQWSGSRSITLGVVAAKQAIEDAGLCITDENRNQIGVVYGATLACLNVMARFDQQSIREGPRSCDPGMFPDTGVGAPACRVSIHLGLTAFNTTLSNGSTSSLDAVQYGAHFIRTGRAHTVLAGGVEELCLESFAGYYQRNLLSSSKSSGGEMSRPFDRRRNGMVLGEGSGVVVLEEYEHACKRGAKILAEVRGYGTAFDPAVNTMSGPECEGATMSMAAALREAHLAPGEIDLLFASANSSLGGDLMEATAIARVFNHGGRIPPITASKATIGESLSAAGLLQLVAAVQALNKGMIPPTINCDEPDPICALPSVVTKGRNAALRSVLVNAFGCTGVNTSMVLAAA